ncbi:DUF2207 domain-containing protein [Cellulomonas aerilata]|uniref:DUF2207 domain-containing protein n=1 Tax=Cellulomonas aerilata TaxID=515326 RepID=UPI001C99D339|nr:DUF2207 domain-containing protein [Cellulomonas aerilata]
MVAWALAGITMVLALVVRADRASAQTEGQEITRYSANVAVRADGVADVRLELTFDFGDEPGHGPFVTLPTRQAIAGDPERDRLFRITDVRASSDTAPDDLDVERTRQGLMLRIGDEDVDDVSGSHVYVVTYRVEGWVNPAGTRLTDDPRVVPPTGDELYLDVIGGAWEIPLSDVGVTVNGPAPVDEVLCFAGGDVGRPCTQGTDVDGDTATSSVAALRPGEPFTIVVVWPAGTFPGVRPIVGDAVDYTDPWVPTRTTGGTALLIAGVGSALAVARARRGGRDRAALGLPTGMVAGAPGGGGAFREHRPPVAVQSTPPDGVLPGELGTLLDEVADPRDVTATIVDLAVRGYLEIREVPGPPRDVPGDWELVEVSRDRSTLTAFESRLLADLFRKRDTVRMSRVRTTFASSMAAVQELLYAHVTERGWFTANPRTVRHRWYTVAVALLVLGIAGVGVAIAALVDGLALVGVALVVVGVVVLVCAGAAPARTAAGTEVLAQAVAFKRYLETADPDALRLVHGEDLFSRYLPYAIAFGVTDRWSGGFEALASRGESVPEPTWYRGVGVPYGVWGVGGFGQSVESFTAVTTQSISAATPASSGSSGSGGRGFAGGGVGGGGGGGW